MQRHLHALITLPLFGIYTQNAFANSLAVDPTGQFEAPAIQSTVVIVIYIFVILLQKRFFRNSPEEQKKMINRHKYWGIINFLLVGISPIFLIIALTYLFPRIYLYNSSLMIYSQYIIISVVFGMISIFAQIRRNISIKYAIIRTLANWLFSIACIHVLALLIISFNIYKWHHVEF